MSTYCLVASDDVDEADPMRASTGASHATASHTERAHRMTEGAPRAARPNGRSARRSAGSPNGSGRLLSRAEERRLQDTSAGSSLRVRGRAISDVSA
jgi:hypothetical protein